MKHSFFLWYNKHAASVLAIAWICISSSRLLNFWIPLDDSTIAYTEGDGAQRLQFLGILLMSLPLLFQRRQLLFIFVKNNLWLFVLMGYCAITLLWGDLPFISFKRLIKSVGFLAMVAIVLTEKKPFVTLLRVIGISSIIVLGVSLILILFFPQFAYQELGGEKIICGATTHKNQLGHWAFTAIVLFLWQSITSTTFKKRLFSIVIFIIGAALLISCKSAASIMMTFVSVFILGSYYMARPFGWKGFAAIIGICCATVAFLTLFFALFTNDTIIDFVFGLMSKDSTFTGRTLLWEKVIGIANQTWVAGHGFGSFWLSPHADALRYTEGWDFFQAHNGYLDTYLHLGIIGCLLTLIYIVDGFKGIVSLFKVNNHAGVLVFSYLIASLAGNYFETVFSIQNHEFWFISVLACIRYPLFTNNDDSMLLPTREMAP